MSTVWYVAGNRLAYHVSAAIAFDPQKAMFQPTTGEVVVELPGDESRQLGAVFGYVVQELGHVLLYDRVERRFLRLVSAVANQIGLSATTASFPTIKASLVCFHLH